VVWKSVRGMEECPWYGRVSVVWKSDGRMSVVWKSVRGIGDAKKKKSVALKRFNRFR
jgi:hypothetical protein